MAFVTRRRSAAKCRPSFHASRVLKRAEYDAAGRGSFVIVERSMSDRYLGKDTR
jgi:hypothetical protein